MFFNIIACMKKALLTPMLAILFLFGCKKEDEYNYYPPYQISALITASKPTFKINNHASRAYAIDYKFNAAETGDILVLNLNNNPVTLLDSVLMVDEDIVFDPVKMQYDTVYNAELVYIYDTTFFRVDFKVAGKIVQVDTGYSTGYKTWRADYLVR